MLNHQSLRRSYEAAVSDGDPGVFLRDLFEALDTGELVADDFSVRQLFENFVTGGREIVDSFNPRHGGVTTLLESVPAVSTALFTNITGQVVYSRVLNKFNDPGFLWPYVVESVPTPFNGERIPGIGRIGDQAEAIPEGENYPYAGVSEEYIETPATTKRGFIVPVTKEAIFFDRTGLVLQRAGEVAYWLGQNKEKRVLDEVFGITNSYKRNGTTSNTYLGSGAWINVIGTNALVDWTNIQAAELLFDAINDPNTGEPISVQPDTIIVPTALKYTAKRIINATEIRIGDGDSNTTQTISTNPISGNYQVLSSPMVKSRTSSASTWFVGQPKEAFKYMENWPITVTQSAVNSEAEFMQDVVARFKVSERGAVATWEPRRMVKATA